MANKSAIYRGIETILNCGIVCKVWLRFTDVNFHSEEITQNHLKYIFINLSYLFYKLMSTRSTDWVQQMIIIIYGWNRTYSVFQSYPNMKPCLDFYCACITSLVPEHGNKKSWQFCFSWKQLEGNKNFYVVFPVNIFFVKQQVSLTVVHSEKRLFPSSRWNSSIFLILNPPLILTHYKGNNGTSL